MRREITIATLLLLSAIPAPGEESGQAFSWSFDRLDEGLFTAETGSLRLRVLRQAEPVPAIAGQGVRLSRLDALRGEDFADMTADGTFSIQLWVKVEWASRRHGHGDLLNLVTADARRPWIWRVGFPTTWDQVMPPPPWPLFLRISAPQAEEMAEDRAAAQPEAISTAELPVYIEPWQWTHVGFVGDGETVAVYRNGGLIGYVDLPEDGLPQAGPARGTLQVNGSNNYDLEPGEGKQGVWECDMRVDELRLLDTADAPQVEYPNFLSDRVDALALRLRLSELEAPAVDRFLVESLIRRAARIDGGEDSRAIRLQLMRRIDAALAEMEKGKRPLTRQRGHFALSYRSAVDQSEQPYEVYVPRSWNGEGSVALVVALHGSTEDETVYFERYSIEELAEEYGWIVAAPYGRGQRAYRDAGARDVLDVIAQIERQWPVDAGRIYVTGHSMGGMGAVHLPMRYPQRFAASAPIAGWTEAGSAKGLREIPFLWVVGENDGDWATDTVRRMMEEAESIDAPHRSLVLEGYDHGGFLDLKWPTVVEVSLPQVFEFFAQHSR